MAIASKACMRVAWKCPETQLFSFHHASALYVSHKSICTHQYIHARRVPGSHRTVKPWLAAYTQTSVGQASFAFEEKAEPKEVVLRFFDALNSRDMASLFSFISEDCVVENLAVQTTPSGKYAVTQFYLNSISSLPSDMIFVLDDVTSGDDKVGVSWHIELNGESVPMSRGVGMYSVHPTTRKITHIRDSPEHVLKLALPTLAFAAPAFRALGPAVAPLMREIESSLRSASPSGSDSRGSFIGVSLPDALNRMVTGLVMGATGASGTSQGSAATDTSSRSTSTAPYSQPNSVYNTQPPGRGGPTQPPPTQSQPSSSSGSPISMRVLTKPGPVQGTTPASLQSPSASYASASSLSSYDTMPPPSSSSQRPAGNASLTGLWERLDDEIDAVAYERMLDILKLSSIQKTTARLIEGVDVKQTNDAFDVNFVTIVPFFRVTKSLRFGRDVSIMRRDLRFGSCSARAERIPGGVKVAMRWGAPEAGSLMEEYVVQGDGRLHVGCTVEVGGNVGKCTVVYARSSSSRDDFLKRSKYSNRSMDEVMSEQAAKLKNDA